MTMEMEASHHLTPKGLVSCKEPSGYFVWQHQLKPIDTSFLEWLGCDWLVYLIIPSVRPIKWLKWKSAPLDKKIYLMHVSSTSDLVWSNVRACTKHLEGRGNSPGSSELVGQFVDVLFGCIRSNSTVGGYNVANGVRARIRMAEIDELTMVSAVFLDKQLGDFAKGRKICGKVL